MRTIKFRVWSNSEKQMSPVEHMKLENDNVAYVNGEDFSEYEGWFEYYYNNDFELMQFTGLKDKNGTEIYEGDIVKFDPSVPPLGDMPQEGEVGIIEYILNSFLVVTKNNVNYNLDEIGDWVVIGNIYEDPEYQA